MRKLKWLLIFIVLLCVISNKSTLACNMTDKDALSSAKNLCKKMGIDYSQEPWVLRTRYAWSIDNSEVKDVEFGKRGDYKISVDVNCATKEADAFFNWDIKRRVRKKYKISPVTTEPRNWPPFLSESKAKGKIFAIARKIGLPSDVEFSQLGLDKNNGYWTGDWKRKYMGYEYETDTISITIMAVDGELFSYYRNYYGKPCPTEVKVNKEEAIEQGWSEISRLFGKVVYWWKYKRDYEIKSAELRIVQPNTLAGQIVRQHSTESRLAWVIDYGLKTTPTPQKLNEVSYLQLITIKIDAATMKFLGGDFTQ